MIHSVEIEYALGWQEKATLLAVAFLFFVFILARTIYTAFLLVGR